MKTIRTLSICLALSTVTFGGLWLHSQSLQSDPAGTEDGLRSSIAKVLEQQHQQRSRFKELSGELSQLRGALENANQERNASAAKIRFLEEELKNPDVLPAYFAKRFAGIPGKKNHFVRLLSPAGSIHAEHADYSSRSGSQLNFKTPDGRIAVSASQIHPVILTDLGLSLEELRADQQSLLSRRDAFQQYSQAQAQFRQVAASLKQQKQNQLPTQKQTAAGSNSLKLPRFASELTSAQLSRLAERQAGFDAQKQARFAAEQKRNQQVIIMRGGMSGPSVLQTGGSCQRRAGIGVGVGGGPQQ